VSHIRVTPNGVFQKSRKINSLDGKARAELPDRIAVDAEYDLDIPSDLLLQSIVIGVEIKPMDATVAILGWGDGGTLSQIGVIGSQERIVLPFIHRHIAVKAVTPVNSVIVTPLAYRTARGNAFVPPGKLIGKCPRSQAPPPLQVAK